MPTPMRSALRGTLHTAAVVLATVLAGCAYGACAYVLASHAAPADATVRCANTPDPWMCEAQR